MPQLTLSEKLRHLIFEELQELDSDVSEDTADSLAEKIESLLFAAQGA